MIPCISQVTTLNTSFEDDLGAYSRAGWSAVEIWLTKLETHLETHSIEQVEALFRDHGLSPLGAASQGGLLLSHGEARTLSWDLFRKRLGYLEVLGTKTLVITPDFVSDPEADDVLKAVESLKEAGELAATHGVRLALEFQRSSKFCASLDTTLALVAQCETANVGVCLDLFHYYTGPSKFEDLAYLNRENLLWVQLCDLSGTPREVARDYDRILPGDGDFQIGPILEVLTRIGYDGCVSLELLNPQMWQVPAAIAADAGLRAMARLFAPADGGP